MTGQKIAFSYRRGMRLLASTALLSCSFVMIAAPAMAHWITEKMDESCEPDVKNEMAEGIRKQIEDHVARAEASINPAIPIGDLSCLNDLMNAPLDIFSNVGGLLGNLQAGLAGALNPSGLLEGLDVSRQICQFAQDKWNEVSEPLSGSLGDFTIPNIADAFSSVGSGDAGSEPYFNNPSSPSNKVSGSEETPIESENGTDPTADSTPYAVSPEQQAEWDAEEKAVTDAENKAAADAVTPEPALSSGTNTPKVSNVPEAATMPATTSDDPVGMIWNQLNGTAGN